MYPPTACNPVAAPAGIRAHCPEWPSGIGLEAPCGVEFARIGARYRVRAVSHACGGSCARAGCAGAEAHCAHPLLGLP